MIPIDVYYNMVNLKFQDINVKYDFTWYFHVVVHKNYNYDNSFNPPNYAFTLKLRTFSPSMVKYTRKYSQLCKKRKFMKISFENMS
jgi:hypothetical protein